MEDQKTVFKRLKEQVEKSSYQKDLHFMPLPNRKLA